MARGGPSEGAGRSPVRRAAFNALTTGSAVGFGTAGARAVVVPCGSPGSPAAEVAGAGAEALRLLGGRRGSGKGQGARRRSRGPRPRGRGTTWVPRENRGAHHQKAEVTATAKSARPRTRSAAALSRRVGGVAPARVRVAVEMRGGHAIFRGWGPRPSGLAPRLPGRRRRADAAAGRVLRTRTRRSPPRPTKDARPARCAFGADSTGWAATQGRLPVPSSPGRSSGSLGDGPSGSVTSPGSIVRGVDGKPHGVRGRRGAADRSSRLRQNEFACGRRQAAALSPARCGSEGRGRGAAALRTAETAGPASSCSAGGEPRP